MGSRTSRARRLIAPLAASCAALLAAGHDARADGVIHPEVGEAVAEIRAARGPEVYTALRHLWRTWDRADPAQVEAALESVAQTGGLSAPGRAYAELLGAYARRRRGDLDAAVARVERLGFVGRWLSVGPFDNDNKAGSSRVLAPELDLGEAIVPGRAYDGKERPVRWRDAPAGMHYGWFDFGDRMRPREAICGFATTFVRARAGSKAPRRASLWIGAAGAFRVFWGKEKVVEDAAYRELDVDRFAASVDLDRAWTRLTVKVCNAQQPPTFALRIADPSGAPDPDVEVSIALDASAAAAEAAKGRPEPKKRGEPKGAPRGAVQLFEATVAEPAKPGPAALEAYARYLATTGGDPAGEHRARDLARRAAEAQPTVERLLLAGELAEDRNQTRGWLERAAALAGAAPRRDLLLARARLERTGPNWRDAVPLFDRVLAIAPDDVAAILGRVELYLEAGLKRTALATLDDAVRRQPSSVALLRAYADQLRALGRDTEASEVESRYAALRFDDSGYLGQQVELAVARRDVAGAERWLDRLVRSEPDAAWAQKASARAYRALGQPARALAAYQRALDMAPEDTSTLKALADFYGEENRRDEQLKLLRQILVLSPQAKDVREYVEHVEPPKPRADEAYAWGPERFLPGRAKTAAAARHAQRTLRSLTVTTVFPNGLASRFRQVVFQPLNDEAAAGAREYAFEYDASKQVVQLRAAKVYRQDGKVDEAIESGEGAANNPDIAMYTSQRTFYVHFPRLGAGDVVELRYRVEDVALRNEIADYYGEVEYLGSDQPVENAEYVLVTPKARALYSGVGGLPGLAHETREAGADRIDRWWAPSIAATEPEPRMPPWGEIVGHVHVSTFKTWDEVGAWYWGLAKEQLDVDDEVRKKTREITKGSTDERAKVRAVYKYVTQTRYVALELGIEGIRPRRAAQTLARGWGDCKDKASLIVVMLRELGIPATLVLVRTRMRGDFEPEPASLAPFDHAIAYVPSLDLYLDGTAEHTGTGELPAMDRNAIGLLINEGKPKLVRLPQPPPEQSVTKRRLEATVGADGSAQLALDLVVSGAPAAEWRDRYLAEASRRERATRDLASDFGPVEIAAGKGGIEAGDLDDVEQPARLKVKARAATFARREGEALSLPVGPAPRLTAELASLSTRKLPVVIPALTQREDEWTLKLPAGARIVRAPAAEQLDTPFGRYSVAVEQSAGKVVVRTMLALKKDRIAPSEYAAWRLFCERVDAALGQRLVIGR